jgi:GYF domain 2
MPDVWFYEVNGFELGPVPTAEIKRLLAKGRVAADTPIRPENGGQWLHVQDVARPKGPTITEHWHIVLLDRYALIGIPLAVALTLAGNRPAFVAGMILLTPFAVACARMGVDLHRRLESK